MLELISVVIGITIIAYYIFKNRKRKNIKIPFDIKKI